LATLEEKFHEHFYNGTGKLTLSNLISIKQGHDEFVLDFVKRFREIKNRCFSLIISEKDLADLAFFLVCALIEYFEFLSVNQLL
jgi:hypothetical protein